MKALSEQTVLVTGSTAGHGRRLAEILASEGATVLIHGRDPVKGEAVRSEIATESGNESVRFYAADFAELDQVRDMAARIQEDCDSLECLVNNAGIGVAEPGGGERLESTDGAELRFQVNYLAHHLLTRQLLPLVRASAPARIVNVSSAGQALIDFADPMLENRYDGHQAYCQSKLAQVMETIDLAAELDPGEVTVNALHPATYMDTQMIRSAGIKPASDVDRGARATLRLIADPSLDGMTGLYFDHEHESAAHSQAYDDEARRSLAELSERLSGV